MESYFWLSRTTVGGAYVLSLSIHWLLRALSLVEERRYPKTGRKWCRFSTATVFAASVGDACRQLKLSIGPRTFRSPSVTVQFRETMSANSVNTNAGQSWESVHVCPNCRHVMNLAELDLRAITTGIVLVQVATGQARSKYRLSIKCLGKGRLPSSDCATLTVEVEAVDVFSCRAFCECMRGRIRWQSSNHHRRDKRGMFSVEGSAR